MSRPALRATVGAITAAMLLAVPVTDALAGGKKGGGGKKSTSSPAPTASPTPTSTSGTTTTDTTATTDTTTTSGTTTTTSPTATATQSAAMFPSVGSLSAHLRLTIVTTSDWTTVRFTPGTVAAQRTTSLIGLGTPKALPDGFQLTGVTGAATAVVDLTFYEPTGASSFAVNLSKGTLGTATLNVENLNAPTPVAVVNNLVDALASTTVANLVSSTVSRSTLFTAVPLMQPRADSRALTLAFYYPWYASYDDPTLADRPSDPRTSWDPTGVASMTAQAKANGVNGFVVSYAGDVKDGPGFDAARRAAESQGQYVTGYIEVPRATSATSGTNADPVVVRDWLVQLLARQGSSAFLKADDGVPVVFVYGLARLLPKHWAAIQDSLSTAYGLKVHLVGDSTDPAYLPYEWGVHRYDVLDSASTLASWSRNASLSARAAAVVNPSAAAKLYVGTASPGFDDSKLRGTLHPVVSRDGTRYADTWAAARAGQPDWVVVTSWNEWFENTQIEPGVGTGSTALAETATQAATFRVAAR